MSLIARYLPAHRLREAHRHAVAASPAEVWRAARGRPVDGLPFVPPTALAILDEDPGRELLLGAIGRFWEPGVSWRVVEPARFAAFDAPGWGKVAWAISVEEKDGGGAWVARELRATATDEESWAAFRRCFGRISPLAKLVRSAAAVEIG